MFPLTRPSRRISVASVVQLIAASLLWSGQGLAVKLLSGHLQPLLIALVPFYGVVAVGLPLSALAPSRRDRWARAWRFRFELLLAGTGGQLLAQAGMTLGVSRSLASDGAILSVLIPVFGAALAVWLLRERLSRLRVVSLLLGITGTLLLSGTAPDLAGIIGEHRGYPHLLEGNLLIVAGCFGSAFYNVYSKRLLKHLSALEILFFSYLASAICGLPLLALLMPRCLTELARLDLSSWLALGYLAFGLYGLSMVFFLRALRQVDAIFASAALYLVPFLGVALSISVLHERLSLQSVAGSAIVLLSAFLLIGFDTSS
jgi:drug/metabolite transporter (DMT)-like permease